MSAASRFLMPYAIWPGPDGIPLPGAKLYSYLTGPGAASPTYSNAALTIPNTNPVVADADGAFGPMFLNPSIVYAFVLTDADGVQVWTADPVQSVASSSSNLVESVNGQVGIVVLTAADIGGFGGAALLNVGTSAGTVAAGDDARIANAVQKDGSVIMTGLLTLAGDPTAALNPTTKQYVDSLSVGLNVKASVTAASTANVNIASAPASLDTIAGVVNDRWALKNQTSLPENGLYQFNGAAAALTRVTDMDAWSEVPGSLVFVNGGATNAGSAWLFTGPASGTINVTSITVSQFLSTGVYQPANATLSSLASLVAAADQIAYFTGANTLALTGFTGVGRTLLAQTTQALMRSVGLGLGSAALEATGASGHTLPFLDATNSWTGRQDLIGTANNAAVTPERLVNAGTPGANSGVDLEFYPSGSTNGNMRLRAFRDGADNSVGFRIGVDNAGVINDVFELSKLGILKLSGYPAVGAAVFDVTGTISSSKALVTALVSSGAATLTLTAGAYHKFTGTTTTWTLPLISGSASLTRIEIKNCGSGDITLVPGGADKIFTDSQVTTFPIGPGEAYILTNDGTQWNLS